MLTLVREMDKTQVAALVANRLSAYREACDREYGLAAGSALAACETILQLAGIPPQAPASADPGLDERLGAMAYWTSRACEAMRAHEHGDCSARAAVAVRLAADIVPLDVDDFDLERGGVYLAASGDEECGDEECDD